MAIQTRYSLGQAVEVTKQIMRQLSIDHNKPRVPSVEFLSNEEVYREISQYSNLDEDSQVYSVFRTLHGRGLLTRIRQIPIPIKAKVRLGANFPFNDPITVRLYNAQLINQLHGQMILPFNTEAIISGEWSTPALRRDVELNLSHYLGR